MLLEKNETNLFHQCIECHTVFKKKNQDGPFSEDERMSTASVLTAATAGIHRNYFSHSKGS